MFGYLSGYLTSADATSARTIVYLGVRNSDDVGVQASPATCFVADVTFNILRLKKKECQAKFIANEDRSNGEPTFTNLISASGVFGVVPLTWLTPSSRWGRVAAAITILLASSARAGTLPPLRPQTPASIHICKTEMIMTLISHALSIFLFPPHSLSYRKGKMHRKTIEFFILLCYVT